MSGRYGKISDEALIMKLRDGETDITDYIMNKYKDMVRNKAKTMFILGADSDDLIQEGMIGLFKAIRDYDPGRDASFYTFADLCILRQMYTAVQSARRQKHIPLNSYISLYGDISEGDGGEETMLLDLLTSGNETNPEEVLINRESLHNLETIIDSQLSPFEKQVIDLFLTGMSYSQIAKVLGKDERSTDNALQRAKTKIKKVVTRKEKSDKKYT